MNLAVLRDAPRTPARQTFKRGAKLPKKQRLDESMLDLSDAIAALEGFVKRAHARY